LVIFAGLSQASALMEKMNQIPSLPVFSIIVAVYNGEKYIEQTINSVLEQTYPQVQLIIIDGGSTDGTVDIIRKYDSHIHYWESKKDKGVYDAWNKALTHATGDWISFLGADDYLWDKEVLHRMVGDLQYAVDHQLRFVYGKVHLLSASGKVIGELGQTWEESKKQIKQRMTVVHCASFHHRSLFLEHGQFNVHFKIAGDYEFVLREFVKGGEALFVNQVVAGMRTGGLSANINLRLKVVEEEILARKMNHLPSGLKDQWQLIKARVYIHLLRLLGRERAGRLLDFWRALKGKKKLWSQIEER
jgi:glycosyltransferase involved in cell wall biosynthesis